MPLSPETLETRAVKSGVKASKKRHHLISEEELLSLKIQTLPSLLRLSLVLTGVLLIISCWLAWPSGSNTIQTLECISGIILILFGIFGIRRTLSSILDCYDSVDFVATTLDLIGEAVSNIDL